MLIKSPASTVNQCCLPWQGITIVIPHTLGNTPKKLFLPGGHSSKSAGGNLVNPLSVLLPQSGAICGSKVEAKRSRESLQSQGQSQTIIPKPLFCFSILHVRLFTGTILWSRVHQLPQILRQDKFI